MREDESIAPNSTSQGGISEVEINSKGSPLSHSPLAKRRGWKAKLKRTILHIFFLLAATSLILGLSARYINPILFWPPSLMALLVMPSFIALLLLTLVMLYQKSRLGAIIGLLLLAGSIPIIGSRFGLPKSKEEVNTTSTTKLKGLSVLSWNIQNFGLFGGNPKQWDKVRRVIDSTRPTVFCLQEYYARKGTKADSFIGFAQKMGYTHHYEYYTFVRKSSPTKVGLCVFSSLPLSNFKPLNFGNTLANGAFSVDLNVGDGDTVHLYNVHLQSNKLDPGAYGLSTSLEGDKLQNLYKNTLSSLRSAYRKRGYQVELLKKDMALHKGPTLLCGDLNDVPLSYTLSQLSGKLKDYYPTTHPATWGATYHGGYLQPRIDYILSDTSLPRPQVHRLLVSGSDHYPILARW